MKGLSIFLKETWWVFATAAAMAIVMAWLTGWMLYVAFLPALAVIAIYMATVRYDSNGRPREESRRG